MLDLSKLLELKDLPRAGWLRVGIEHPESVAAHSWGMACLAAVLSPDELDLKRVLLLCVAHDLPEIIAGDITPHDGISAIEKKKVNIAAKELLSDFPVLMSAWKEYEENLTPEAHFSINWTTLWTSPKDTQAKPTQELEPVPCRNYLRHQPLL